MTSMPGRKRAPSRRGRRSRCRPRRPRPGDCGVLGGLGADRLLQHLRVVRERRVQGRHVVRGRALLRAVDRRGALGAGQRVVDVAGQDEVDVGEPRVEAGQVGRGQRRPARRRPGATGSPSASRKRAPSAASMPAPPSVVALPPTPNTMVRAPASSAAAQQFAGAVRGGRERGEDALRAAAGGPTASAISTTAVPSAQRERRGDLVAERPGDPYLAALESGRDRRGDRAVAAVGDGQGLDLQPRVRPGAARPSPARRPARP